MYLTPRPQCIGCGSSAARSARGSRRTCAIGLGTAQGQIQVKDEFGQPVTLEVPPDTETLTRIAQITGAKAFDAPTAEDLKAVYANLESRVGYVETTQEVTFALVAAGLVLVVIGAGASALWFGRLP